MAVDKNSVHSVSKQYQDVACETSLRYNLKKLNMEELIKSNEKIFLQELIKTLKTGKSYEFAIDFTDDPYYGKTDYSNDSTSPIGSENHLSPLRFQTFNRKVF